MKNHVWVGMNETHVRRERKRDRQTLWMWTSSPLYSERNTFLCFFHVCTTAMDEDKDLEQAMLNINISPPSWSCRAVSECSVGLFVFDWGHVWRDLILHCCYIHLIREMMRSLNLCCCLLSSKRSPSPAIFVPYAGVSICLTGSTT